jgi:hypothetical protein
MSWRRRYRSVDANHQELVAGLEALGFDVHDLAEAGHGLTDVLVGRRMDRRLFLLEFKRPFVSGTGMRRKDVGLNAAQEKFHRKWSGYPVFVVHDLGEAVAAIASVPVRGAA